jgi:hypothetical protein
MDPERGSGSQEEQEERMKSTFQVTSDLSPEAIEKQNRAFERLSKKQKRLAIARDVIQQVQAKKYRATPGRYVKIQTRNGRIDRITQEALLSFRWKDYLDPSVTRAVDCEVCGIGAAFVSRARLGNKVDFQGDGWHDKIRDIFSANQQVLIETAFEGHDCSPLRVGIIEKPKLFARAMRFCNRYTNDNVRLVAIFRNILKNDGTFKP